MGTNFYYKTNICDECGRFEKIHIGKRSCGWTFLFRLWDNSHIRIVSYRDWLLHFNTEPGEIVDEYDGVWDIDEFKNMVSRCQSEKIPIQNIISLDDDGFVFDNKEFC